MSCCIAANTRSRRWRGGNGRRGFTLVESAMAVLIAGVLMASSLSLFAGIIKQRQVMTERRAAFALNRQLLGEILSQYFQDPSHASFGPAAGQVRSTFASVDDYNGYSETTPQLKDGTVLSDYTGWTRSVAVSCVDPNNPLSALANTTLKFVTVTCVSPTKKSYSLSGMRSKYGINEFVPQVQTNLLTYMSVGIEAGGNIKSVRGGARPLNILTSQQ